MKSLSIIVPAFNEEKNIRGAVEKYERIAKELFDDYEIIIVDDGSRDNTSKVADELKSKTVKVCYHAVNMGIGAAFETGLNSATKDYVILLSGEGDPSEEGVKRILSRAGQADVIISYMENENERPWYRRLATKTMTALLNVRFGYKIHYYSGFVLYRREDLHNLRIDVSNSAYQAQILVQLLRKTESFFEVPYRSDIVRGKSSVFKPKNILRVGMTLLILMIRGS